MAFPNRSESSPTTHPRSQSLTADRSIVLDQVTYGYPGRPEPVLENFRTASTGAPESRTHGDTAELLASLANRLSAARAVAAARQGIGLQRQIDLLGQRR